MSTNGFRVMALNGLVMIALAMVAAGFPLIWAVGREFYHSPQPINLPGDSAAWLSAHMIALMSGMVVIIVAQVTRLKPMARRAERLLSFALLVAGWGNTIGSLAAPLLGVRGIEFDWDWANNVLVVLFGLAAMGIIYAIAAAILHLARPIEP